MRAPPTLSVVATHLRPAKGFGGVVESTSELIIAWRRLGKAIKVVTSDGTRGDGLGKSAYETALQGPVRLYHAAIAVKWGFGVGAPWAIARTISGADRIYISGIATWPVTLAALIARALGRPYVVAPRGGMMAEHWHEIRQNNPVKALFYHLFVLPSLRAAHGVHASSTLEASDIRQIEPKARVFIVPNAFSAPPLSSEQRKRAEPAGGLKLLYLGRLSAEKSILGFAKGLERHRGPNDRLLIAGAPEGSYGEEVLAFCAKTPWIDYLGVLGRDQLSGAFAGIDALVLPSGVDGDIRENFGNVVVEALLHARPTIVTRGLAWDGIDAAKIGVTFNRDLSDLGAAVQSLRNLVADDDVFVRAVAYAKEHFSVDVVAERLWNEIF